MAKAKKRTAAKRSKSMGMGHECCMNCCSCCGCGHCEGKKARCGCDCC